jgi:hypothetical protein
MSDKNLGRLQKVELREVWLSESSEFTPWLARDENLKLLSEAIGIELECEAQEKEVGPFRADILCKDTNTDNWVLIENQLERTDHGHLGQLLTYAAGLDAVTIVWIANRFTEEHRAALDWLNKRTDEKINFFGLEVELWRIGDSPVAPKFNVISRPNDWTRDVSEAAKQMDVSEMSDRRRLQFEYWTALQQMLGERKTAVRARTGRPRAWVVFAVGRSGFNLWAEMYVRDKEIGVGLTCKPPYTKTFFQQLKTQQQAIEKELGFSIRFEEAPDKAYSYVSVYTKFDPEDRNTWPQQHEWIVSKLEAFHRVFSPRVRNLPELEAEDARDQ